MAKTEEELIGYAAVDSGQILLTDPAYVYGSRITIPREPRQINFAHGKAAAVLIGTEVGDGRFPVYAIRKKKTGQLLAIMVSISDDD